jgi:cbb3-type cytochrome oxidase subunit 1
MEELDGTLDDDLSADQGQGLSENMKNNLSSSFSWMRTVAYVTLGMLGLLTIMYIRMYTIAPPFVRDDLTGPILIFVVILGLEIYILSLLIQASNAFKSYTETKSQQQLELAFAKQKSFWNITGVLAIIGAALFLIGFIQLMSEMGGGRF